MLYKRSLKNSRWWVRFTVGNCEVRRSTGTSDRHQAEEYERKLRDDVWRQTKLNIVRRTWDQATDRWITEHATKRSLSRDKAVFSIVHDYLHGAYLDELDRETLGKLRQAIELPVVTEHPSKLKGGLRKPATVVRILAPIRAVLRACVTWGWLTEVPPMTVPKLERSSEPRFITRTEFDALYKQLPVHLKAMARFSVETGQRFSAVAKLQWSAVDLKRRHAFITSSTSKSKKPVALPLNESALKVLSNQKGKHAVYVFCDHKGRAPMRSIKSAWTKACTRAGLNGLRWHDLRHTWASWHTQNGTPPVVLKELGGWASLAMVERYSHLSATHLANWVNFPKRRTKHGTPGNGKRIKA